MLKRKMKQRPMLLAAAALLAIGMAAAPSAAFAQSCALCYTSAASAGTRMIQALQSGILILIVPPTLMSIGMIFIVYHKRHQFRPDSSAQNSRNW